MDDVFYPCNKREREILSTLSGDKLEEYKRLRHAGSTVTEAIEAVDPNEMELRGTFPSGLNLAGWGGLL